MLAQLLMQLDGTHFPIKAATLPATIHQLPDPSFLQTHFNLDFAHIKLNHPGDCFGYKFTHHGKSVVIIPDNQLHQVNTTEHFDKLTDFCKDVDILIHDAQYLSTDMPQKADWGHSLVQDTCRLARDAGVKDLILFHHDPNRTDSEIDGILEGARNWFKKERCATACRAAFDGMTLSLR